VARDIRHELHARAEARRFAEHLLEARTMASVSRAPVSLGLATDDRSWKRLNHMAGDDCKLETAHSSMDLAAEGITWKIQGQAENGQPISGRSLCWHPTKGLLLDSAPLGEGKLLVTLNAQTEISSNAGGAFVLVSRGGAELQTLGL
jgi:hypothetical protein